ncbi:hypothetical protein DM01DRAFT_1126971 [Hesseltinella vesiculosa]|uniref:PAS domain-containing protein n=1 Tax=Hesseltinella vesiculosa TaxID=101127 RepID=A0A1X2GUF7_9FUNG|nr:hypothetical protein DM01DRAFT_1126971 [Hesseltinella vesiculosa]
MSHTFDACPQRSSSLFVVHPKTQKILLVTKDICDLLGYMPMQLIGHSISSLQLLAITDHRYIIRHESSHSQINLDVCIHLDPELGVELWAMEPISYELFDLVSPHANHTVVRLDAHRCIDYTTSTDDLFAMPTDQLLGRPLLSFIHPEDQPRLVDGWNNHQLGSTYQILHLRWQSHPSSAYQWVSLTMTTHPRRQSYGAQLHTHDDPLQASKQLILLRPAIDPCRPASPTPSPAVAVAALMTKWTSPPMKPYGPLWLGQWILSVIVQSWLSIWQTLYQGQRYLVEFLAHLLISLLDFLADCIDPAAPDTASSVRVSFNNQKEPDLHATTEVPWFRPMHRKRWATAVRTVRRCLQSNTVAQKSISALGPIGAVAQCSMFDYLEKVTSENFIAPTPLVPSAKPKDD